MFAIGAFYIVLIYVVAILFLGAVLTVLFVVVPLLPQRKWRVMVVIATLSVLASYPFIYRASASYSEFKKLCESSARQVIFKKTPVDFVYFDEGYASNCVAGAKFIDEYSYRGFDCLKRIQDKTVLHRFTKLENWYPRCGLKCFSEQPETEAEASYKKGVRYGYIEKGDQIRYF